MKRLNSVIPAYFFRVPELDPSVINGPKGNSHPIVVLIFDARINISYAY